MLPFVEGMCFWKCVCSEGLNQLNLMVSFQMSGLSRMHCTVSSMMGTVTVLYCWYMCVSHIHHLVCRTFICILFAFYLYFATFNACKLFSVSSSHLHLGL
jgi:hypothetical protein